MNSQQIVSMARQNPEDGGWRMMEVAPDNSERPLGCCADPRRRCHRNGHATREEAEYCHGEWKAKMSLALPAGQLATPQPCGFTDASFLDSACCGIAATWAYVIAGHHDRVPLCESHRNLGAMKKHLGIPPYFVDPRYPEQESKDQERNRLAEKGDDPVGNMTVADATALLRQLPRPLR